jgi:RNA polymerase sigma-70 factor, ECF subfamily
VYNLVRVLSAGDNEAEDLVQDVFVRAYRGIANFRGESTFRSWLYRISVNVVHNHHDRCRHRHRPQDLPGKDPGSLDAIASSEDVEEDFVRRRSIDRALAALPAEMRLLVVLRDVHGLSYEEIAEAVRIPRGTVDSRLFRARQRLRPLLEPLISRRSATLAAGTDYESAPQGGSIRNQDTDP